MFADDASVGLRQEPFVSGADGILDRLAADTVPGRSVRTRSRGHGRAAALAVLRQETIKSVPGTGGPLTNGKCWGGSPILRLQRKVPDTS